MTLGVHAGAEFSDGFSHRAAEIKVHTYPAVTGSRPARWTDCQCQVSCSKVGQGVTWEITDKSAKLFCDTNNICSLFPVHLFLVQSNYYLEFHSSN